jgi:hypothetical protein
VLGEEGATVYVTGRSARGGRTTLGRPGMIDDTADAVSARAGGLRAAASASRLAAPLMVARRRGLIVNITWVLDRPHDHAFYEVVKNATNKLTEQMAEDLRPYGIACVAVSPGFMRVERMNLSPEIAAKTESPEFVGRAVAALAADESVLARSAASSRHRSSPATTASRTSTVSSSRRSGTSTGRPASIRAGFSRRW